MTNRIKRSLPFFAGFLFCAFGLNLVAQDSEFKVIQPQGYATADSFYSPGILTGGTLYISGQGSRKPDGTRPPELTGQVAQALSNVQAVLKGARMNFGNVVWMNIYLTDEQDVASMNEVYWQTIGQSPPARTVLMVAALPDGERVEINCIAVADTIHREAIWPLGWARGPHADPPAIRAGEIVYLSAQGGRDPVTGRQASDFPGEVRQALDNVGTVLKAARLSMKNVLWVNPYMTVAGQYDVMGKIYASYFEFGNTPGRGTIQVVGLPKGDHIVFSCIAGADLNKRKAIRPRNMPPSPTASPGILYGDTLYLSAKDGFIPDQGIVTPDLELQVRQSMRNLLDGLQEADMDFSDVVFSTVYFRQIQDADRVNAIYGKFFESHYPARSMLQHNFEVHDEAAEQISFIAVKRSPTGDSAKGIHTGPGN
jgi:reactive intermediate/imine deaminase